MGSGRLLAAFRGVRPYLDRSGKSGILEYDILADSIVVRFRSGEAYEYPEGRIGREHLEEMKRLAVEGRGLATYISRHPDVKNGYVRPLRP
jgi:hypothetical protein